MNQESWLERRRRRSPLAFWVGLFGLVWVILAGGSALAQMNPPEPSDDYNFLAVDNNYIGCSVGLSGEIANEGLDCSTSVSPVGRWVVWDPRGLGGGGYANFPSLIKDCPLSTGPFEWAQYTTIRYRQAASAGQAAGDFTNTIFGSDDGSIRLFYNNSITQLVEFAWQINDAPIYISLKFTLERNLVRYDYLIENLSTDTTYEVGERINVPTALGLQKTAHSYRMPYTAEVTNESYVEGPAVPDVLTAFDARVNYSRTLMLQLGGEDATTPDRVVFSYFAGSPGPYDSLWDFPLIPAFDFTRTYWGGCASLYWEPVLVAPQQQKRIVFYYGTAEATVDASGPAGQPRDKYDSNHYVLATVAPFSLKFKQGDDPSTPDKETDATYLDPNPFTIDAYVYNRYEKFDFQQVTVALDLPPGLELASGETASKVINSVPAESEGHVSWQVHATGEYTGSLEYSVSSSPSPAYAKHVSRAIEIPAQSAHPVHENWQLISVPFTLQNPDPTAALGLSSFSAYTWDPFEGAYAPVDFIELGKGFWLNSGLDTTAQLTGETPDAGNFSRIYMIDLDEGWNLVGLPYIYPVYWGKVRVFLSDTQEDITVKEAAARGILRDTLFWYDPNLPEPSYDWDDAVSLLLEPWMGYWLRVYHPCTLLIMPLDNIGASKGLTPSRGQPGVSRTAGGSSLLRAAKEAATPTISLVCPGVRERDSHPRTSRRRPGSSSSSVWRSRAWIPAADLLGSPRI
jgi:hypothetical protein